MQSVPLGLIIGFLFLLLILRNWHIKAVNKAYQSGMKAGTEESPAYKPPNRSVLQNSLLGWHYKRIDEAKESGRQHAHSAATNGYVHDASGRSAHH